jgi:hypothetical protein
MAFPTLLDYEYNVAKDAIVVKSDLIDRLQTRIDKAAMTPGMAGVACVLCIARVKS